MKTLNFKKGVAMINLKNVDITDRQPCWYVDFDRGSERSGAAWKVGVRAYDGDDAPEEYKLKLADVGDVTNDSFWDRATSFDFALQLLDEFRNGTISSWIAGGCK
jgi:hypothetical protein